MNRQIIKVEGLAKRYQLGVIGYGSLQQDVRALWAKVRGKADPNVQIGGESRFGKKGDFWALRDVSFDVEAGDRLGVIGRNGAGKSTLLKVMSRITSPTAGKVKLRGRVASLLEVGTGFHPELTGRENVFLNGAILGMKRAEILRKFDEIVEFAGVEDFIDTPVKRYSSGMYVRLAFSVAANLDTEILIIDEVLAVGDAAFQKKSIEKMQALGKEQGRTILFVSHSIPFLNKLCNKGLLLDAGKVVAQGGITDIVSQYMNGLGDIGTRNEWVKDPTRDLGYPEIVVPRRFFLAGSNGKPTTHLNDQEEWFAVIEAEILKPDPRICFTLYFYDEEDNPLFSSELYDGYNAEEVDRLQGPIRFRVKLPNEVFLSKVYSAELVCYLHHSGWVLMPGNDNRIKFSFVRSEMKNWYSGAGRFGSLFLPMEWEINR